MQLDYRRSPAADENGRAVETPIPLVELANNTLRRFRDWPRSCNGVLFAIQHDSPVYFESADSLFAWFAQRGHVNWNNGRGFVTQRMFFEHLRRVATKVAAIERARTIRR